MNTASTPLCPVCSTSLTPHLVSWVFKCPSCGFQRSTLAVDTEGIGAGVAAVDETVRREGLDALRKANFETILDRLAEQALAGKRLLEVGSAHGWFLREALARGYDARGIEPDGVVVSRLAPELAARTSTGFFPQDLPQGYRFDVIVFNDVFEHLPDVDAVLEDCRARMSPGGTLVLNLPYASGVFYRTSELMARVGRQGPFERMWQRRFPSPHLSYFEPRTLARLCAKHGFIEKQQRPLKTLRVRGLWARLSCDQTLSRRAAAVTWAASVMVAPFLSLMPADVGVQFFKLERS